MAMPHYAHICRLPSWSYSRVQCNVPLNTLHVILETIFPANHVTGANKYLSCRRETALQGRSVLVEMLLFLYLNFCFINLE